ncbi:MAG: hypothetical protein AAFP90_10310 [Planctomycetota bacterium]
MMSFSDSASAVAQRPGQSGFAIGSPDRSQQKKQEITTVVYSIADLLQLLAGSSGTTQSTRGGMGGMEYDMGGGLSDMGGGMGMMGGMGGMGDNTPKRTSAKRGGSGGAVTIVNLLTDHVLPQSASDSQMMISIFNDSLVVSATNPMQQKVATLLKTLQATERRLPSVNVELRMIPFESGSASSTSNLQDRVAAFTKEPSKVEFTLRIDNHQTASISSGLRKTFVTSVVPVVGSDGGPEYTTRNVGYQPQLQTVLLGLFGSVGVAVDDDGSKARIKLDVSLTSAPEETQQLEVTENISIDRVEIQTGTIDTTVRCQPDQWTLAGVVASVPAGSAVKEGPALEQMAVLLRWSVAEKD